MRNSKGTSRSGLGGGAVIVLPEKITQCLNVYVLKLRDKRTSNARKKKRVYNSHLHGKSYFQTFQDGPRGRVVETGLYK